MYPFDRPLFRRLFGYLELSIAFCELVGGNHIPCVGCAISQLDLDPIDQPSVRNLPEIDAPAQLLVDFVAFRAVMSETSAYRATEPSQDAFSPHVAVEG